MNIPRARPASPSPLQIRRARRAAGLDEATAAGLVHATANRWSKWEAGEQKMPPATWELFTLKATRAKAPAGAPSTSSTSSTPSTPSTAPSAPRRARRGGAREKAAAAESLTAFAAIVERRALQWAASVCEASMTTNAIERQRGVRAADWNAACAECAQQVRALIPRD